MYINIICIYINIKGRENTADVAGKFAIPEKNCPLDILGRRKECGLSSLTLGVRDRERERQRKVRKRIKRVKKRGCNYYYFFFF
ncbi:hypothetical protein PUN28_014232 [Cardiocondyla obscurior]|uniref:Uncharacterized protein n=1 Tax=Cardiocondyla obscurior TaxID=286306 RepID=A0AAW2EZ54_9HYME